MRIKLVASFILFSLLAFVFIFALDENTREETSSSQEREPEQQPVSVKKPKSDYMSALLSRNTRPLGLKEDLALKKLMKQPSVKWAVRAGARHVLN